MSDNMFFAVLIVAMMLIGITAITATAYVQYGQQQQ